MFYKSKHGFVYRSRIDKDAADLLRESWEEYSTKYNPGEKDRAKNVSFDIPCLGRVCLSLTSGSVMINSDKDENFLKEFLVKHLGPSSYESFVSNLKCLECGVHFGKFHGTVGINLKVDRGGNIPIWISVRGCKEYSDVHLKIPYSMASFKTIRKGLATPSSTAKRKYLSDTTIVDFIQKNKSVMISDATTLGVDKSAFYRRLKKLVWLGKLIKVGRRPALYTAPS